MNPEFERQFSVSPQFYLNGLDFLVWYRFFFLLKDALRLAPQDVLEVGGGSGFLRRCLEPEVARYQTMDINPHLAPEILQDVRVPCEVLRGRFDLVIAADVLEHIPFADLPQVIANLKATVRPGGHALITIPHRQSNFLFMGPAQIPRVMAVPTGFLSIGAFWRRFIRRRVWIDPNHCWEIGDGHVRIRDVEAVFAAAGWRTVSFRKLLYVDYWVLHG